MKIGRSSTLKSPKYIQKRKKRRLMAVSISILISIIVILSFIILIKIPFFQIKNIEVNGVSTIDKENIKKEIQEKISGNYLYLIPKSNFLFYPKNQIEDAILANFKKIKDLNIDIHNFSNLILGINERTPEVIVCDGFKESEDDNTCYFSDINGYVFERMTDATSTSTIHTTTYFKYYINSTTNPVSIGNTFIDTARFSDFQKFNTEIKNSDIVATGILINEDGNYELYIKNIDESIAVVYFDQRETLEKTLSNLLIFWKNANNKKIGLDHMPNFDYIDLRFGNNVFYLIKDNGGTSTK